MTAQRNRGPLDGIKVIDLGRIVAGPFVGMTLGDLGADVIKVESPPEGDRVRAHEPRFAGDVGAYFATVNRNKRSLRLDLRSDGDKRVLARLLAEADVLVENFRPGVLEAMGFTEEVLERTCPRLVVARISAYGHVGPDRDRPGVDQLVQGISGLMAVTGTRDTGPIRSGIAISDLLAGLAAVTGILAALYERERSGRGQVVRTSLLEATLGVMSVQAGKFFATGEDPAPEGNHHPVIPLYGTYPTKDGHVQFQIMHERHFAALARLCRHPEWLEDPRLNSNRARMRNKDLVRELVEQATPVMTSAEWIAALRAADVPCGPILGVKEAFESPQARALDMILETSLSSGEPVAMPGFPVKLSRTPTGLRRPPPHFGEHTEEILSGLDAEEGDSTVPIRGPSREDAK